MCVWEGRKDTLNTFYLRLYGIGHMVKDHSDTFYLRLYGIGHMVKDHSDTFYLRLYGIGHMVKDHSDTFYLRLYGIGHMVKDHSDSERGNLLPPHGLLFPISSKGSFICTIPHRITHTTAFVTPVVEHWLEREIAQWVLHHEGSIRRPIAPWVNALTTELHLAPSVNSACKRFLAANWKQ